MVIDFHTHIFPPFMRADRSALFSAEPAFKLLYQSPKSVMAGAEALIGDMDKDGVGKSVVFGFPWGDAYLFKKHNDYIIESVLKYPDRLIGFSCFSIHSSVAAKEAERCFNAGLKGVGELAVYGSGLTKTLVSSMNDLMELCAEKAAPVLLHVNEPVGHQYPGKAPLTLSQIYHFLKTYPGNRIVLAHWGGGILFFALMKKEVRGVLKHVWFDTAASPYLYVPDIYRIAVEILGEEKILLGTDYPLLKPRRYFKEMALAGLNHRTVDRISGLNASALFSTADG